MIYVHVPFCRSFCTYCDFFSERACPTEAYVDGVCREALERKDEIAATVAVDTLYIGGGTPSVLPLPYLARIADACGGRHYEEWTVEVNPDDITPKYARGLRALGVNRVSMGVQSLDDGILRWMNRRHDADGARRAFRALRAAGFDNISIDLIFGIGGLDDATLRATLAELLDWRPEHISAYQLSVEEGSMLGRMAREGRYTELPDEACAAQYYLICNMLRAAGYEHYEISNWALPGRRAVHNSAYWTRAPYVGLGPGAHSLRCSPQRITTIPLHPQGNPRGVGGLPPGGNVWANAASGPPETPWVASLPCAPQRITTIPRSSEGRFSEVIDSQSIPNLHGADLHHGDTEGVDTEGLAKNGTREIRSWNSEELSGWTATSEVLTEEEIREERIMLGLRTAEGIPGYGRIPEERWFVADDIIASLL